MLLGDTIVFYYICSMEQWRDIPEYEGYYQVSDLGRVKRLYREDIIHNYGGLKIVPEKILKPYIDTRKYNGVRVTLCRAGLIKRFILARLVATVFIPNDSNLPLVEHLDDNPTNNKVTNLKWGTHSSNAKARFKTV